MYGGVIVSKIEWTDVTWNPVTGCSMVHDGCKNCYALTMSARLQLMGQAKYKGTTERLVLFGDGLFDDGTTEWRADWETFDKSRWRGKPRWSRKLKPWPEHLGKPLEWKKPRRVFVNSMSDLFNAGVPFEYIAAVFAVMAATPHKYVILTKWPARAVGWFAWIEKRFQNRYFTIGEAARPAYIKGSVLGEYAHHAAGINPLAGVHTMWPMLNVAIGVSVSDQDSADEFLPLLAQIPTVAPIVSVEPMLGLVDLRRFLKSNRFWKRPPLAQVIIGAESGPGARPCQIEWVRDLAKQVLDAQTVPCVSSGPALFVKQWPVCSACSGRGYDECGDGTMAAFIPCAECSNTGQSRPAMTKKRDADKTPRLHVPGYVLSNWTQPIRWPS